MPRAHANGIELEYETFVAPDGDAHAPPLVMIMGLASQMIVWPDELCGLIAAQGFRVTRFDNRDVGLSTKPATFYTLDDMADDAAGLLDALDLPAAHVVGASMGGYIAQLLALRHPARVRSLCIIMSSTGARDVGGAAPDILPMLMQPMPSERAAYIEYRVKISRRLSSTTYPFDEPRIRALAAAVYDRSFFPLGGQRQLAAVMQASDRTARLAALRVPTLVLHGADDPIVASSGGEALARAIPGAALRVFPGMAHDLPAALWPTFAQAIAENANS
ncbi:MAG TPA: alpha/beta fold hydrolase [Polyangia bacterium]|nr:alpha/beta fold hydrolase [Polyangia bacterium]